MVWCRADGGVSGGTVHVHCADGILVSGRRIHLDSELYSYSRPDDARTEPLVPVFPLWEQHGLFYRPAAEGRFQVFAERAGPRTDVDRFDASDSARPPVEVEKAGHDS